jgi:hypothetical protein
MKVKIIKSKQDTYWYAGHINEEYIVELITEPDIYQTRNTYKIINISSVNTSTKYIDCDDCEILNDWL